MLTNIEDCEAAKMAYKNYEKNIKGDASFLAQK